MKLIKPSLKVIGILIAVVTIALFFYSQQLKPTYDGKLDLELNNTVDVYFDSFGIPHIYAQNNEDAYKALGYAHAQERLWQMELLRRVAPGRLSEVFGEQMIDNDKFFISIGLDQQTKRISSSAINDEESYTYLKAYLEGVNSFIDNGFTPVEYTILGLEKKHFVVEDVFNILGYMSFSFAAAQKTDPLISYIQNELGDEYITDLMLNYDPKATFIANEDNRSVKNALAWTSQMNKILDLLPVPTFNGSNSWVVNKDKTSTGNVILANDPHIGYSQPAVWYEAHLSTPGYERYGYLIAGVPFPLLSHNRDYGFGLTMFENDDIDFYQEVINPTNENQYKTDTGWNDFTTRVETINIKDADPIHFTVRETHHGPIINDVVSGLKDSDPVSMYWIYTQIDENLLNVLFELNNADSMEDFESKLPKLHAPGLNMMYGDKDGNIAWWATAQLYNRLDDNHPKMIKNGVYDKDNHIEMIPFSMNPHAVNPTSGYVYSANNATLTMDGKLVPGYYASENRAKRIVELLEPKNDWNKETIAEMIVDDTSSVISKSVTNLISSLDQSLLNKEQKKLLNELDQWEGDYPINSYLPSLYHRWEYEFLRFCFLDELGEETTQNLLKTHLSHKFVAPLIAKDESPWFDRIDTDKKEVKSEVVTTSFIKAIDFLTKEYGSNTKAWEWGKLHQVEHPHPLGNVSLLRPLFNVGPNPIAGARDVINAVNFNYTNTNFNYTPSAGPSTRRIIDFSDVEHSISILPTGQSGNPFSKHYDDQTELYNVGKFRPMLMNKQEIIEDSEGLLIFMPISKKIKE